MRRTDRELKTNEEIMDVFQSGKIVQLAFADDNEPYLVTLNYGFVQKAGLMRLYFHSAVEGRKIDLIRKSPAVCFTIAICDPFIEGGKACNYGMKYRSVVGYGRIRIVESGEERKKGLDALMKQYTGKENWDYDDKMLKITTVSCLDIDRVTGKRKM